MTLYDTIRTIKAVALQQPAVASVVDNDVFRLNAMPDARYGVFAWTQGAHTIGEDLQTFAFTFFYVDRLTEDLSNEVEIQSVGIQVLTNIITALQDLGIFTAAEWTAQTFNQRFADECAGVFASVRLEVPQDLICAEEFENNEITTI